MDEGVCVIGGGLAGVEAAWAIANRGIAVDLFEMKGVRFSPAHHSENLAELVCYCRRSFEKRNASVRLALYAGCGCL